MNGKLARIMEQENASINKNEPINDKIEKSPNEKAKRKSLDAIETFIEEEAVRTHKKKKSKRKKEINE